MGLNDWIKKVQDKAKQIVEDSSDPKKVNANRQELLKKGAKILNKGTELIKSAEELTKNASQKTIELTERVAPLAEQVDEKARALRDSVPAAVTDKLSRARDAVVGTAGQVTEKLSQKFEEVKQAKASHPSTGSPLLDLAAGAVPETDATKPKKDKDTGSAPPKP